MSDIETNNDNNQDTNTQNPLKSFYDALEKKNNNLIEETIVVKLLDYIIENEDNQFHITLEKGTSLFRAREINCPYYNTKYDIWKDDNGNIKCNGYNEYESKEPPITIATEGRNNIIGMSYLYLAKDPYTACAEIKPNIRSMISLATFETKKDLRLINFNDKEISLNFLKYFPYPFVSSVILEEILKEIYRMFSRTRKCEYDYLATQYIFDRIRKAGYDGINYYGSANYGTNYTIFNSHKMFIRFVKSDIIVSSGITYHFTNLETEEKVCKPNEGGINPDLGSLKEKLLAIRMNNKEIK